MTALSKELSHPKLTLKNRWAMAPMTRSFSPDGIPTQEVHDYYVARAKGGVGLIITEGIPISHESASGYPDVAMIHHQESQEVWKKIIQDVHKQGCKIIPQLWHVGGLRKVGFDPDFKIPSYAPSEIIHPRYEFDSTEGFKPTKLTGPVIDEIISSYGQTAKIAKDLGFDGVEIHAAHGYLIDQFFWKRTNNRTDEYGGSFENRLKFALDVIKEIRKNVGDNFPIIFRFSEWKLGDYQFKLFSKLEELELFLTSLKAAGVDIFHASTRRFWESSFESKPLSYWTKKLSDCPVITVGSIGLDMDFTQMINLKDKNTEIKPQQITQLEKLFNENCFDIAAVGRCLISDSQWVNKIENNQIQMIKPFSIQDLAKL